MKRTLFSLLFAICCIPAAISPGHTVISPRQGPPGPSSRFLVAGEELLYEVSWWVVKLGTIRLRVVDVVSDSGGTRATVRADIDSYENLPFASIHSVSETVMDGDCFVLSSFALTQDGNDWRSIRYVYDPHRQRLLVERGRASDRTGRGFHAGTAETLAVGGRIQDGLSIFYFARASLFAAGGVRVPTIVEGARGNTAFHFPGERSSEEIDAVDHAVDVLDFGGVAEFSGIYGLTGDFEGWFSNDDARVPISANMGVTIGSVKIELISWKRDGWIPPRSPED